MERSTPSLPALQGVAKPVDRLKLGSSSQPQTGVRRMRQLSLGASPLILCYSPIPRALDPAGSLPNDRLSVVALLATWAATESEGRGRKEPRQPDTGQTQATCPRS